MARQQVERVVDLGVQGVQRPGAAPGGRAQGAGGAAGQRGHGTSRREGVTGYGCMAEVPSKAAGRGVGPGTGGGDRRRPDDGARQDPGGGRADAGAGQARGRRTAPGRQVSSKHLRCHEPPIPQRVKSVRRYAIPEIVWTLVTAGQGKFAARPSAAARYPVPPFL
ncbi:hypothetical protein GCM10010195_05640 [Kitasatospora griseola]|nr:hypothetical protein GCM10010195_05640 [Kitasatospora griseola]